MTLYEQITSDMKEAMKNHDKERLSTIRLLKSAIDLYKINNKMDRANVEDDVVIEVASKQIKTHKASIQEFSRANRQDLVDGLKKEIEVISKYLPEELSKEEIEKEINAIFDIIKPTGKKDMGKIMKEVSTKLKGRADMSLVSEIVNSKLDA